MLDSVPAGRVIFRGEAEDSPLGLHLNRTGKMIKWMAIKGYVNDWTIYTEDCYRDMDWSEIMTNGHKILPSTAKQIINAPEEVWDMWRS